MMAALSYLLPVIGPVIALLFGRGRLATWHALQSLLLTLILIATCLIWAVLAWLLNWIPVLGTISGVMLFAVVPLVGFAALIAHGAGVVLALHARYDFVPIFGPLLGHLLSTYSLSAENR